MPHAIAEPHSRHEHDTAHARVAEQAFVVARFVVVALIVAESVRAGSHAAGVAQASMTVGLALAVANFGLHLVLRRVTTGPQTMAVAAVAFVVDFAVASAFVWLHASEPGSGHVLLFFLVVVHAAVSFRMVGALVAWSVCAATTVALQAGIVDGADALTASPVAYQLAIMLVLGLGMALYARQLARTHAALATSLDATREAQRWRDALVDILAHDLRASLGTAAAVSATLEERFEGLGADEVRRLVGAVGRQSRRALRLADDLLDLARLRGGRLTLHPRRADVGELVRGAIELLDPTARPTVTLDVDGDVIARIDRERVEQVLVNLLDNAVRHGAPPLTVTVARREWAVEVAVGDHGDGVPDELVETLFDPLVTSRTDGGGLGLWLARLLTEAHGGTLDYRAKSRPTFVMTLPVEPRSDGEAPTAPRAHLLSE